MKLEHTERLLKFKFSAGTSRGTLTEHKICIIKVSDGDLNTYGLGEAAPLKNLSIDTMEDILDFFPDLEHDLKAISLPTSETEVYNLAAQLVPENLPSLRFGLECAMLDLINGGERKLFDNAFWRGETDIPINGLIWMGDEEFMKTQIDEKLKAGFKCIKMKIGAIDFEVEMRLLEYLRAKSDSLIIRVDANGGIATNEVFGKLSRLAKLNIHSIEQPIMPQQHEAMQLICLRSELPVALDEELIGIHEMDRKRALVQMIRPRYVILKPTLLGGLRHTLEWISIAEQYGIGWWLTSALESSIGLNAISQLAGQFPDNGYQGLGTGQIYENNIQSPLEVNGQFLGYNTKKEWERIIFLA
ncbi:MAG: o-succinylbenzoate synthase [Marinoscillum sp.]